MHYVRFKFFKQLEPVKLGHLELFITFHYLSSIDIEDETGELAANLTEKYLAGAELGNFTSMTPGLTDVSFACSTYIILKLIFIIHAVVQCSIYESSYLRNDAVSLRP